MTASLSTHVLDVEQGRPASGLTVELYRGDERVGSGETDSDGRIPELAAALDPGPYRLVFVPASPFFRRVELEIVLDDGHYHVPLLVSSYSCVTYRGSRAKPSWPSSSRVARAWSRSSLGRLETLES